jgi:uncharacterized protein YcbX
MALEIGRVGAIFRYPVKSMAGEPLETARLGRHGIEGDRRFAFRRIGDAGGFPWLSASRLPELILYRPFGRDAEQSEPLPTHVRTIDGAELELRSEALRREIAGRFGSDVELMRLDHGIFDDAAVSVIAVATVDRIAREAGCAPDCRRFRPNVLVESAALEPFGEDAWVGGRLAFGDPDSGAAVAVTLRDLRCMMINLDPDTAARDASMMKTAVRMNGNNAGVYATVLREGDLAVGQSVWLIGEGGEA